MARSVKDEALRGRVVAAATAIISAHGNAGLSVRAVARRCDVAPGTIYNYFSGLDEIVRAVRKEVLVDLDRHLAAARAKHPLVTSAMVGDVARAYLGFALTQPNLWAMVLSLDEIPRLRKGAGGRAITILEAELRAGLKALPHVKPAAKADKLARALAAFIHGQTAVATHAKTGLNVSRSDFSHDVVDHVTRGLARMTHRPAAPGGRVRRARNSGSPGGGR